MTITTKKIIVLTTVTERDHKNKYTAAKDQALIQENRTWTKFDTQK